MSKKLILSIGMVFLFVVCLVGWRYWSAPQYPEVDVLASHEMDFDELSAFFTKLAQTKGATYAYEVLGRATLPVATDMHLLGHVVGDELYKQKGIEGMSICTQDFRNACSHSIVVGYFLAHGEDGLLDIAEACRRAPGGSGAYTMCFHGLGHGILAATGYDMPLTVALCQKNGTAQYRFREASECVGGAVMEIITGGFHDKAKWEVATSVYLSKDLPLLPCTAEYMPDASRPMCLEYLTPHLVTVAGESFQGQIPQDDVLVRAFGYCKVLENVFERSACFSGFGKEFIVLAGGGDIRKLVDIDDNQIREVFDACALADDAEGELVCLTHALDSLYWGGENDPKGAIRFCSIMMAEDMRSRCFSHLVGAMKFFIQDKKLQVAFCRKLPAEYEKICN